MCPSAEEVKLCWARGESQVKRRRKLYPGRERKRWASVWVLQGYLQGDAELRDSRGAHVI
ncbi:hypothetical protein E2C01_074784 [Portunus trituberculatus]|uniref:Uncharacterized protein n=1 Tax=Portunus trituberculatus TaxID=210409 RepID=A0A5B7I8X3_PORTR|nr:hypothetical protein [Portunus trituberculatus]